jgi:hypothetical protein
MNDFGEQVAMTVKFPTISQAPRSNATDAIFEVAHSSV